MFLCLFRRVSLLIRLAARCFKRAQPMDSISRAGVDTAGRRTAALPPNSPCFTTLCQCTASHRWNGSILDYDCTRHAADSGCWPPGQSYERLFCDSENKADTFMTMVPTKNATSRGTNKGGLSFHALFSISGQRLFSHTILSPSSTSSSTSSSIFSPSLSYAIVYQTPLLPIHWCVDVIRHATLANAKSCASVSCDSSCNLCIRCSI